LASATPRSGSTARIGARGRALENTVYERLLASLNKESSTDAPGRPAQRRVRVAR
jgi:hypothetical protein